MQYGVTMFTTDQTMGPAELARAVEERGLHSLYLPEHTHIPISRRTPPPTGDEVLREEYKRTLDPFVALAAAAAVTDRVLLGTGICLVAQREPIVTAKAVATLDQLSGGRFVLGIGFGWNEDELEHHGVTMKERRDVTREHMLAMRALWSEEQAEFHGEHVDFAPSWSWPKPARHGDLAGPPVLIGGAAGPKMFAAIAEYADGWIPIGGRGIRAALPELHEACESVGRDPSTLRIVPFGTIPDPGKLEYYASLGIEEIVLRVPSGTADETLPLLDEFATLPET
jgi:probable F420-dependent oxidoreductase